MGDGGIHRKEGINNLAGHAKRMTINPLKYRNIISVYKSGADMDFKIALSQDEDGWYIVTVPALPGCVSQGKTEEEAKKNIAEAIELHLSALARDGIPLYHPPFI